jgi:hypothetical protein
MILDLSASGNALKRSSTISVWLYSEASIRAVSPFLSVQLIVSSLSSSGSASSNSFTTSVWPFLHACPNIVFLPKVVFSMVFIGC